MYVNVCSRVHVVMDTVTSSHIRIGCHGDCYCALVTAAGLMRYWRRRSSRRAHRVMTTLVTAVVCAAKQTPMTYDIPSYCKPDNHVICGALYELSYTCTFLEAIGTTLTLHIIVPCCKPSSHQPVLSVS